MKLTSEINRQLLMFNFSDEESGFYEDKFYKYFDIDYIYNTVKKAVEGTEYSIDDPNHVNLDVHIENYMVEFSYLSISPNEEDIYIVAKFKNGICNEITIQNIFSTIIRVISI